MTSKRLYYQDAYKTRFKATIIERVHHDNHNAVILDKTYFYPTSGGQPHDIGKINDVAVLDVTIRETDGAILHWLAAGDIWSNNITADIGWARRFDHMQQHSGQHILSQAFLRVAQAETVGFHLSEQSVTIDLAASSVQPDHIEEAEHLANQVIWQDRPILIKVATAEEANALPLRKLPPFRDGKLRLIEVEEFDLSACGGTHVARTGEIGVIKIVKLERNGDKLRVEFCCGNRALQDYRLKNSIVTNLMSQLTTGAPELVDSVNRLQTEIKENRRKIKQQHNALVRYQAEALIQQGTPKGGAIITAMAFSDEEMDTGELRNLATQLIKQDGVVALLGLAGAKSHVIFCRSADAPGEMDQLLKSALRSLGSASGGGNAVMAQGGGPAADVERVQQAVERAKRLLIGQI